MPHVTFVPFTGFRLREESLLELGMTLPGLRERAAAVGQLPALGLLTLAGMMPAHWTCSYREAACADEALAEAIAAERPTVVALSALTASVEEAYRFSTLLRRRGLRVVLGGLHATACPSEATAHVDAVVCGEGEPVWHQVLADAESGELQPIYRATTPFNLADAPVPRFDLLTQPGKRPRLTLQTQRGCPFACDFCGASRLLGSFREKPTGNLLHEIEAIKNLVPDPLLELADDNTFAGTRDFTPLFEALGGAGARYFTEADWRLGERPHLLASLAQSGCVQVLVGIESLVFRHPGMGAKEATLERVMDALARIQDAGVAVIGCFILGADGEDEASIDRLIRFLIDAPLADVQITLLTPFPGTALHRRLQREGRLLPDRGWPHYTLFDVTFTPDRLSVAELEASLRRVIRAVFAPSVVAKRTALRRAIWRNNPRLQPCAGKLRSST